MLSPTLIIGHQRLPGSGPAFQAVAAATGLTIEPQFHGAALADVDNACRLAEAAFNPYRNLPLERRAAFLESIAEHILAIGDALILRCMEESGLPLARLEGERARTVGQLRMFAAAIRTGLGFERRYVPAQPDRQPASQPDLRLRSVPVGPVAVFGASNFPLAFSVAGGDTTSALAAGCPVIVKAHPAHPGTSALIGGAIADAAIVSGMPEGVFSLLFDASHEIGAALVADHRIKAVGFTGSRRGGQALIAIAQSRPEPIPVFAEMSAINPVLLLPHALDEKAEAIATAFVASLTLGSGQFCTNPGLVIALRGPALDRFLAAAAAAIEASQATTMLTPGICAGYRHGVAGLLDHAAVQLVAAGHDYGLYTGAAHLFTTDASAFRSDPRLQEEVFGPASMVVSCRDIDEMEALIESLEGQLTAAIHAVEADYDIARRLFPALERKVGRILFNGFGTGVEVSHAMVHGGPFPATSDGRATSVGSLALTRFLRPVSYQDCPDALLPDELRGLPVTV